MNDIRAFSPESSAKILVSNQTSALQWQQYRAGTQRARGRSAWMHGDVQTLRQWARQCWEASPDVAESILSRRQAEALWAQALRVSDGVASTDVRQWARWAADAWESQWLEGTPLERAVRVEHLRQVRRWQETYSSLVHEGGWLDAAQLVTRLAGCAPPIPVVPLVTDLFAALPAELALLANLRARGWPILDYSSVATRPGLGQRQGYRALDGTEEIAAAMAWGRAELERRPDARIAIVVPGLATCTVSVRRQIEAIFGTCSDNGPVSAAVHVFERRSGPTPAFAAAVSAIGMLAGQSEFGALSRWLRSPFFCRDDRELGRRCALELQARECVDALLGLSGDFGQGTGIQALLERVAPDLGQQLAQARQYLDIPSDVRTPTEWVQRWSRGLEVLGWPGRLVAWDDRLDHAWERCLRESASLTSIVGRCTQADALQELIAIATAHTPSDSAPQSGVVVLDRIEDVAPGYHAIWVTGMNREFKLGRSSPNPLLAPRSPDQGPRSRGDLRGAIERLAGRCSHLILSSSSGGADAKARPHPLVVALPVMTSIETAARTRSRHRERVAPTSLLERIADRPSAWRARRLPGGARILALQARSPIRAYCEYRLGALPVPAPQWGLSERQRGMAVHRALEQLTAISGSESRDAAEPALLRGRVTQILTETLVELFGEDLARYRRLFGLEREALRALVSEFVTQESREPHRRIATLEQIFSFECAGHILELKVDRMDVLSDGARVIIDYKTGRAPTARDWFGPRLREPQLPLYVLATNASGAVTIGLRPGQVAYSGFWPEGAGFPGRPMDLPPHTDWSSQVAAWRAQIERLVRELAAGDVRIFPHEGAAETDPLLPLTRAAERRGGTASAAPSHAPAE